MMERRVEGVKGSVDEGRKRWSGERCWKRREMVERGFQPAKTSNLERARAISGLWLGSGKFSGSPWWSLVARGLEGWIWRGRALAMERI